MLCFSYFDLIHLEFICTFVYVREGERADLDIFPLFITIVKVLIADLSQYHLVETVFSPTYL